MNTPTSETCSSTTPAAASNNGRSKPRGNGKRARRGPQPSTLGKQTSAEANRRAAVILEVLAGVRLPSEAAQALGISVTHYYILERKALQGLLASCERQPKGRRAPPVEKQLARLERELAQAQRECQRQAALVRATQRAVGLPAVASSAPPAKSSTRKRKDGASSGKRRRRRRRPTVRALRAAEALAKNSSLSAQGESLQQAVEDDASSARKPPADRSGGTES